MAFHDSKSRVPCTLQAVFLASNRGCDVKRAPPNRVGSRIFRTWFTKRSNSKKLEEAPVKSPPEVSDIPRSIRRGSIVNGGEAKKVRALLVAT